MTFISDRANVFEAVIDTCSYLLKTDDSAQACRDYINSRLSKENQIRYNVGYFPSHNDLDKIISMVGEESLKKYNIIHDRCTAYGTALSGHFSDHNLIMPFRNVHGEIVSIMGRSVLPEEVQKENKIQKYKYTLNANKELYIYNLDNAKRAIIQNNCVICVEGQFDCIALHDIGIKNVVALGWATISRYQLFQLSKYTDNIILLLDNDDAGKKGMQKVKSKYGGIINVKTISPPNGYKDIDDFLRNEPSKTRKENAISLLKKLSTAN